MARERRKSSSSKPLADSEKRISAKSPALKKPSPRVTKRLSLRDRLGHLTYRGACRILGEEGESRLLRANALEIPPSEVRLYADSFRAKVYDPELLTGVAEVSIVEMTKSPNGMHFHCDVCKTTCEHVAASLSFILEEKMLLGLSEEPDPHEPIENLTSKELILRAIADRRKRAETERMKLASCDSAKPWTEYTVTSQESGKTYRVALRGTELGQSYCSCPDFRTNQLGICKHILHTISKVEKKFSKAQLSKPYLRKNLSLRVDYGETLGLRFNLPAKMDEATMKVLNKEGEKLHTDVDRVVSLIRKLEKSGIEVHVYPDAEAYIEARLLQKRIQQKTDEVRQSPENHPLREQLLRVPLLPYQIDGIAFAVGAGRAVLADDMGLGKTIQGIGIAELFGRLAGIKNVLVVCPASLKSQWKSEIHRFCERTCNIVIGSAVERVAQYESETFFKIANYEQIVRDEAIVSRIHWDLIILDEGQRIKNWESKTSRTFANLQSKFALVLSGTPLENRLEELFTVIGFVDKNKLGPAYRFFHQHRVADDRGRTLGYKNLEQLREKLKPILLRRTRNSVMQQLPERTTEIVRIRPTDEQFELSEEHVSKAARIASKSFLTEMDLLRLQKHLLMARMAADSTQLIDKVAPGFSSKLEVLEELLLQISQDPSRKIVLFSEWTTMLSLIEPLFEKTGMKFVRLDGGVPQKKRQYIVEEFQSNADCRAILMSNAGATGLNLQSANTIINVDLPWNPAILEQRIARAHRMGQKNPVHVYLLVTEGTIEERLLGTLAAKQELANAALDIDSDIDAVTLESGMEELKRRLEKLIGNKVVAPVDESMRAQAEIDATLIANGEIPTFEKQSVMLAERREKVAAAGGELLGAALQLVSQLIQTDRPASDEAVSAIKTNLTQCIDRDPQGRPRLQLTLPDDNAIHGLAETLAKLLVQGS
jgi:superfamily II DNA or RNA helicase